LQEDWSQPNLTGEKANLAGACEKNQPAKKMHNICLRPQTDLFRNELLATQVSTEHHHATSVSLPPESAIAKAYASMNLADAYSIELPVGASTNPELLARFIFAHQAPWIGALTAIRDALVAGFGLKTARRLASLSAEGGAGRLGIFKIYSTSPTEVVLGEDDKHLDFRLSVLCSGQSLPGAKRRLILSTVVHCHNRLGRLYIFLIAPFHRLVVQSSLHSAARVGWPPATEPTGSTKNP